MESMTVEAVEGNQQLARADSIGAGTLAMARVSDSEFQQRLTELKRGQDRIAQVKRELMVADIHYGVIPGTGCRKHETRADDCEHCKRAKATLLKPGAEVLCSLYGLRPDFVPEITMGDGVAAPHVSVLMRCELHLGDILGPVVAVGYGEANSWERKHRYRRGERMCPRCGVEGKIIKGKEEYGGGWLCYGKKGGCGAKFPDGSSEIEGQQVGDVENPDPHDLRNTIVKMSKKRAFLDAALTGTASSDLFTQDMEEQDRERHASREPGSDDAPTQQPASAPRAVAPQQQAAPAKPAGDLPKSDTKPTCPACKSDRSVICTSAGVWTCAKSKGGCAAELARR